MITVHNRKIDSWLLLILINLIIIFLIYYSILRYETSSSGDTSVRIKIFKLIRFWYGVVLILTCFKEVHIIIQAIGSPDIDSYLIKMDYLLFGVNPTQWAYRFQNPFLTEFLQVIYLLYYFLILIYGLELYLWKRLEELRFTLLLIFLSFFICYVFYIIFPAIGPRFYLHDFHSIKTELPGIILTDYIRAFIDFGESISYNVSNPHLLAQRDAMPSAHIAVAIILAYLSKKFRSKSFRFYFPYCILMTIATIYLRYHYVVDLIAGASVALIAIIVSKYFEKYYSLRA